MKIFIKQIVLACLFLLIAADLSAYAFDNPVYNQPFQSEPATLNRYQMRSTSTFGSRGSVSLAPSVPNYTNHSTASSGQFSVFTAFTSRDGRKGRGNRSWSRDHFLQAHGMMNSGSRLSATSSGNDGGSTTITTTGSSGPRRVNGEEEDDPDPFMGQVTPVGDTPFILFALFLVLYISCKFRKRGFRLFFLFATLN